MMICWYFVIIRTPLESLGRNCGRTESDRGNFLRQQTVPVLFVITSSGGAGGGGHQGAAGGPQVARAGVGSAGVQRVVRGGTTPTPASAPARPEKEDNFLECWEEIHVENVNARDISRV